MRMELGAAAFNQGLLDSYVVAVAKEQFMDEVLSYVSYFFTWQKLARITYDYVHWYLSTPQNFQPPHHELCSGSTL